MHTSDQSPEEQPESVQPHQEEIVHEETRLQSTPTDKKPGRYEAAKTDNDAIRQGLIYPPPPSFYQQQDEPALSATPLPSQAGREEPQFPSPQEGKISQPEWHGNHGQTSPAPLNQGSPPLQKGYMPPPVPPTPYAPGQGPMGMQPSFVYYAPPPKQSKKWLWILITVLIAVILGSCSLCGWAAYSMFGDTFKQATSAVYDGRATVTNYYEAMINKQYSHAYDELAPQGSIQGLTREQFIQKAQEQEGLYGPVYRYTLQDPRFDYGDPNIDHFTIQVNVVRDKKSYTTLLTVHKIGNRWKITDFNQL